MTYELKDFPLKSKEQRQGWWMGDGSQTHKESKFSYFFGIFLEIQKLTKSITLIEEAGAVIQRRKFVLWFASMETKSTKFSTKN